MDSVPGRRILSSSVLVLNRFYMAVHMVPVRRAFVLLYRDIAEVIHVENGQYATYDFSSWCEISQLLSELPAGPPPSPHNESPHNESPHSESPHIDWIRGVNLRIQVPRVIRLTKFDRMPRQTLRFNRRNLFARDGHRCQYCGLRLPHSQLSVDHVIPRSRGGKTEWENVVCSCVKCNTKKGGRTPQEARMKLMNPPRRPKHNPMLAVKLKNPKYQSWRNFLPSEIGHG